MKQTILILIALFTVNISYGQERNEKSSFSLSLGPGYIIRQDLMFSPFIHSDPSILNVGLNYTHQAKLFQTVNLRYGNYSPTLSEPYDYSIHGENETAYPHSFNLIDIDYLIGKALTETEKSKLTAGGMVSADIQAFNYVYGRISSFGYYSAFGLGIFGRYGVALNDKSKIEASLQLPFFAWISRPPYMGIDDEFIENISSHSGFKTFMAFIGDGKIVTWNRLQTVDAGLTYTYSLDDKLDIGAGYLLEFIHSSQPQNLFSFRNSISISLTFGF